MSDPRNYTVGWICALSKENVAARAFLDEIHDSPEHVSIGDNNVYTLGRMGKHNVVIAVAPDGEYGTQSASTVARDMLHTFVNVRIGLMVGIAGGVPSPKNDIRLGDVVVSAPRDGKGGVIQYDFGKERQDQEFRTTGFLNQPPPLLRAAVAALRAQYEGDGHQLDEAVRNVLEKKSRLRKNYMRPDSSTDKLYLSTIVHPSGDDDGCSDVCGQNTTNAVPRHRRTDEEDDPAIHYGLIASANRVMKDALVRDRLAGQGVLCCEMEAAGLMNHFPCLVIRGICDYSDSHKNKDWQGYAAMIAAAYAKDLLARITPNKLEAEKPLAQTLDAIKDDLKDVQQDVKVVLQYQRTVEEEVMLQWLTPIDYYAQQNDFSSQREPGTGQWLLDSEDFNAWQNTRQQTLHYYGIPGAGKTLLTSLVIDHLHDESDLDPTIQIAYIYCNFKQRGQQGTQKLMDLIESLVKQLTQMQSTFPTAVKMLYDKRKRVMARPSLQDLIDVLETLCNMSPKTFIILDALDELSDDCRPKLLQTLFKVQANTDLNIFTTSRPTLDGKREFQDCISHVSLDIRAKDDDMGKYLESRILELQVPVMADLWEQIKTAILKAADGMFLLAQLYFGLLQSKTSGTKIKEAMVNLRPNVESNSSESSRNEALTNAYANTMERVNGQHPGLRELAKEALCWITCAQRPLTSSELQNGLAIANNKPELHDEDLPSISTIIGVCYGLITIDKESQIIRLVHYTTQEYFDEHRNVLIGSTIQDPEWYVTDKCLTYFSFDVFRTGSCLDMESFEQRLNQNPLYDYATRFWGHHMQQSPPEIQRTIPSFFREEAPLQSVIQAIVISRYGWRHYESLPLESEVHLAASLGLTDTVKALLGTDIAFDSKNHYRQTPLFLASKYGYEDIVQLLIEKGANVNTVTLFGRSPLSSASRHGHEAVVRLLVNNGAKIDQTNAFGRTSLSLASMNGHSSIAKILLDSGAAINGLSKIGETPLMLSAQYGHEDVTCLLVEYGATLDRRNNFGQTPLLIASSNGHVSVVRVLLEAANVSVKTSRTTTESMSDDSYDGPSIEVRADSDARTAAAENALVLACVNGQVNVVQLLIESGVSIECRNRDNQTPLTLAVKYGFESVTRLLIEKGAMINSEDDDGHTALWHASNYHRESIRQFLIENGATQNSAEEDMADDENSIADNTEADNKETRPTHVIRKPQTVPTNQTQSIESIDPATGTALAATKAPGEDTTSTFESLLTKTAVSYWTSVVDSQDGDRTLSNDMINSTISKDEIKLPVKTDSTGEFVAIDDEDLK